jgi:hypothetical protein
MKQLFLLLNSNPNAGSHYTSEVLLSSDSSSSGNVSDVSMLNVLLRTNLSAGIFIPLPHQM